MPNHSPRIERLCRALAHLAASDGTFPERPFVLMVELSLVVLFELALLGEVLEAALRHWCSIAWGLDKVGWEMYGTGYGRDVQVN